MKIVVQWKGSKVALIRGMGYLFFMVISFRH